MKRTVSLPLIVLTPKGDEKGPAWAVFPATYDAEKRGVPTYWTFEDALDKAREWAWHELQLQSIAAEIKYRRR